MFNLRRLESISLPSKAENATSLDVSATGNVAIATSAFIVIYQIIPNKEYTGKGLCCKKYLIQPTGYTLKDDLKIDIKEFLFDLPQQKYYECILTAELTPDLEYVEHFTQRFIKCLWSPPRCDKNYDCILATLTNNGIVEIYVKHSLDNYFEFKLIYNITKLYIDILKSNWGDVGDKNAIEKLNELIFRANQVKVKCFTWSKDLGGYFLLILGHLSRKITFWKVYLVDLEVKIEFLYEHKTDLEEISCLTFENLNKNEAFLFIGDLEGGLLTLKIVFTSESGIEINKSSPEINKDGFKIKSINLVNSKVGDFIVFVKVTSLIIISCDKPECYEFECNNIEILDIIIMDNTILILTKTGVIKEIILSKTTTGIDIKWRHFYVDINNYMRNPIGMVTSKNNALIFILTKFCKPKQSKLQTDSIDLTIFGNNERKCLEKLLKNPSKRLTYMWDYLELYRCSVHQTKIPLLDTFQPQNYDKYDLYTLKILVFISKITDFISENLKESLPIKSHEEITSIFHLKLILIRTQYLLNLHKTSQLSKFQLQNLLILSNYIKQVITEGPKSLDLNDSTINVTVDVIQKVKAINFDDVDPNYCICCEEKLDDITCIPPHFDSRCCISLMQIRGVVNFKCLLCNSVVHNEIGNEMKVVVCPFCDIPMINRTENNKID